MRRVWAGRDIAAPPDVMWRLLVQTDRWPDWGPTVRAASLDSGRLRMGATGTVTTFAGVDLRFEITSFEDGSSWAWKVAGVEATAHSVETIGPDRCRVSFGVPLLAAPYLVVCRVALGRLEQLAAGEASG